MHNPPTLEDVLDVVRRYVDANYPGSRPLRLDIRFYYGDGEQLIRLPIPLVTPPAARQKDDK
jgi:hypothetical protein